LSRTNVKWNNARTEYFRPQRGIRHDLQYVNIYRFTHHYKVQMFTFKPLPIDQKLCFSSIGHMFTIAFRRWESWFLAIMSSCSVVLRYLPHKISLPKSWKTVCNFLHSLRIQVLFITSNFLNSKAPLFFWFSQYIPPNNIWYFLGSYVPPQINHFFILWISSIQALGMIVVIIDYILK
jgi:hypothetical protein